MAMPRQADADRAIIAFDQCPATAYRELHVGKFERLFAIGKNQRVESAECRFAIDDAAIQARIVEREAGNARQAETRRDPQGRAFDSEVGLRGIADHDIAYDLGTRADFLDRVGRLDPQRGQLVGNQRVGNAVAPQPCGEQHREQHQQQDERNLAQHTPLRTRRRIVPLRKCSRSHYLRHLRVHGAKGNAWIA